MASRAEEVANNILHWIHWTKAIVCIWFVRIFWPIPLLWGGIDWLIRELGGIEGWNYAPTEDDVAIRTFGGVALFLVWLFLARRRGPFTLNRDGILERRPNQPEPPPRPIENPYNRKPGPYGR
jgi:hypothetical protein